MIGYTRRLRMINTGKLSYQNKRRKGMLKIIRSNGNFLEDKLIEDKSKSSGKKIKPKLLFSFRPNKHYTFYPVNTNKINIEIGY